VQFRQFKEGKRYKVQGGDLNKRTNEQTNFEVRNNESNKLKGVELYSINLSISAKESSF
jgi:hypothetical protein